MNRLKLLCVAAAAACQIALASPAAHAANLHDAFRFDYNPLLVHSDEGRTELHTMLTSEVRRHCTRYFKSRAAARREAQCEASLVRATLTELADRHPEMVEYAATEPESDGYTYNRIGRPRL